MNNRTEKLESLGVRLEEKDSVPLPMNFGDPGAELTSLRKTAVWFDRSFRARVAAIGPDRLEFLNALFSNDLKLVAQGRVSYGFFLNRQGRTLFECRILPYGDDRLLVESTAGKENALWAHLDKFHFSEAVELEESGEATAQILLAGPKAKTFAEILFPDIVLPSHGKVVQAVFEDAPMTIAWNQETAEDGYELFFPAVNYNAITDRLASLGVKPAGWSAWNDARIEAGVPAYGAELTEDVIPLEAGLRDLGFSFKKGCYIGQEIIARIDAKGEPAKRLVGFSVEGPLPAPGTPIHQGEREVGRVTSSVMSQSLRQRPIAMGYVKKNVEERAEDLTAGEAKLWIVPRPFYPPQH